MIARRVHATARMPRNPVEGASEGADGPLEPFSPQAGCMTQPVTCGARWPRADLTCSESSPAGSEALTCEEPRTVSCPVERAHRIATPEPRGEAGSDAGSSFCARADTVVEGFLCNDPVAV